MTKVFQNDVAVWWESGLNVDADGAYNAYAPGNKGLDYTANAGKEGNWYGILVDKDGDPVIQGPDDPSPGSFIATTALADKTKAIDDPHRYVDSATVPYLSIPSNTVKELGLHVGDVGFAYYRKTDTFCSAVVADVGPKNKYGEGSIALCVALGIDPSPRHGGASNDVVCVVLKGSSRGWPRDNADVDSQVKEFVAGLSNDEYQKLLGNES